MRADYDSEADALDIELFPFELGFARGGPASIELLTPAERLDLLDVAAERYDLDGNALRAAAQAALAAPDRVVTLEVGAPIAA